MPHASDNFYLVFYQTAQEISYGKYDFLVYFLVLYVNLEKIQLISSAKKLAESMLRKIQIHAQRASYINQEAFKLYNNNELVNFTIFMVLLLNKIRHSSALALSLIVRTESCPHFCLCTTDYWCNYWKDLDDYHEDLRMLLVIHQLIH